MNTKTKDTRYLKDRGILQWSQKLLSSCWEESDNDREDMFTILDGDEIPEDEQWLDS